ncbi:MAG: hypothetical protein IPI79_13750 [Moraxellaceae bacterium]|nr:hypothetical protein [Moraxellaceae bacterium]
MKIIQKPGKILLGLIVFYCALLKAENGFYLKSDMKRFSEIADDAFYLSDNVASYSDRKYWFALLTNDWLMQVKD